MATWFHDYVFEPLGGNRVGDTRFAFNVVVMWTLIGLWHGASWHFVAWGVNSGIILAVYQIVRRRKTWSLPDFTGKRFCGWLITLPHFALSALLFRVQTLEEARIMLGRLFTGASGAAIESGWYAVMALLLAGHATAFFYYREDLLERRGWLGRVTLVSLAVLAIVAFGASGRPFIYFQF
jgi:alginate O-acetyltransferase complex protein AlgI